MSAAVNPSLRIWHGNTWPNRPRRRVPLSIHGQKVFCSGACFDPKAPLAAVGMGSASKFWATLTRLAPVTVAI
jgi:hypothetical protein